MNKESELANLFKKIRFNWYLMIFLWLGSNVFILSLVDPITGIGRPYSYRIFSFLEFFHKIVLGQTRLYPIILIYLIWALHQKNHPFLKWREKTIRQHLLKVLYDWGPILLCFIVYSNIKLLVPMMRPEISYDAQLLAIDKALFLGHDPVAFLQRFHTKSILGITSYDLVMGRTYIFFFGAFFLSLLVLYVKNEKLFHRTVLAMILCYIVGTIFYFIFPSVGPAFLNIEQYNRIAFKPIRELLRILSNNRQVFLQYPYEYEALIFDGIAAFPSLHIAHTLLFFFFVRKLKMRFWNWFFGIFFIMNSIATVYCGLHYVTDVIGGIFIAIAVYFFCMVIGDKLNSPTFFPDSPQTNDQEKL